MASKKVECECYLFYDEDEKGNVLCKGIKPVYMTKESACADIAVPKKVTVPPHSAVRVPLMIGFEIREGYKIVVYPRSSLLIKKGLFQPVSIIDSDFSGQEISAPLFNVTDSEVVLDKGERVAQIECVPAYDCQDWDHKNDERGQGGFGSTGAK